MQQSKNNFVLFKQKTLLTNIFGSVIFSTKLIDWREMNAFGYNNLCSSRFSLIFVFLLPLSGGMQRDFYILM